MINCSDNTYIIYYTDSNSGFIAIPKSALDQQTIDLSLVGKTRLEYGQVFNENMLHMLEHFSSPSANLYIPDTASTIRELLEHPVIGQVWYNSEYKSLNVCVNVSPIEWREISSVTSVSGNSGIIAHGEQIPLPEPLDGYDKFNYSDCVWNISPYFLDENQPLLSYSLSTDSNAVVSCSYTTASGTVNGVVNYIILGVRGNNAPATQDVLCPTPTPSPTPSTTPESTPTPTPTMTISASPTPTPTPTVTPTITPSGTPAVTPTPTVTPTITPSGTPAVTPTPTVTPSLPGNTIENLGSVGNSYSMSAEYGLDTGEVRYRLDPDYSVYRGDSETADAALGTWLSGPPGNANNFEISFVITSQDPGTALAPTSASPSVWYPGGINIVMWADNPNIGGDPSGAGFGSINFDITIREIANTANAATFSGTMSIDQGL